MTIKEFNNYMNNQFEIVINKLCPQPKEKTNKSTITKNNNNKKLK